MSAWRWAELIFSNPESTWSIFDGFRMLTKKNNKRTKYGRRLNGRRNQEMVMYDKPPPIPAYNMKEFFRFRFTSVASALRTQISFHDLTDLLLMPVTAVLGYKIFTVVKIKFVEVWDDDVAGGNASVAVSFSNTDANQVDDPQTFEDISLGIYPAHVLAKPKKDSLSSKWHGDSGNNAFAISCSAGAIIDVGLSLRQLPGTALAASNALVGATVGLICFRGLDGVAVATTNFLPPVGTYRI